MDSAHADPNIADEAYTNTAATTRGFFTGIKVWEAACLNCHDTHTVQGARRLLREGTDSTATPKAGGAMPHRSRPAINVTPAMATR